MTDSISPFTLAGGPMWPDKPVWDAYLSVYHMPALAASDQVGLFDALAKGDATVEELSAAHGLNAEALRALLPMLAALGFLAPLNHRYALTQSAKLYLVKSSPYYWGHAFVLHHDQEFTQLFLKALRDPNRGGTGPADAWETGVMDDPLAERVAAFMNSHSVPGALALAGTGAFAGVKQLLDVGGGSGCFSLAFVRANPELQATVMDLPAMCRVVERHIDAAGLRDRVRTAGVDMFREAWPEGHDALFFSNIFHDWDPSTNANLAAKAFAVLSSGGRIFLNEMLLADDGTGPIGPASFGMMMLLGTKGRQYSAAELRKLLEDAGFRDFQVMPGYGYYSLVSAVKP